MIDSRRRVTHRRQLVEASEDVLVAVLGLKDNDIWCRRVLIRFDCGDQSPHLNTQMRSGHAPIFTGRLDRGGDLDGFAERLH